MGIFERLVLAAWLCRLRLVPAETFVFLSSAPLLTLTQT